MKQNCEIIKDLLPLYIDDACSHESKKSMEEHLQECIDCNIELENLKSHIPNAGHLKYRDEVNPLKTIKKKNKIKLAITSIFVVVLTLMLSFFYLLNFKSFSEIYTDPNSKVTEIGPLDVNHVLNEVERLVTDKWNLSDETVVSNIHFTVTKDGSFNDFNFGNSAMDLYDPKTHSVFEIYINNIVNKNKVFIQIRKYQTDSTLIYMNKTTLEKAKRLFKDIDISLLDKKSYCGWDIYFSGSVENLNEESTFENINMLYVKNDGNLTQIKEPKFQIETGNYSIFNICGLNKTSGGWNSSSADLNKICIKE